METSESKKSAWTAEAFKTQGRFVLKLVSKLCLYFLCLIGIFVLFQLIRGVEISRETVVKEIPLSMLLAAILLFMDWRDKQRKKL